MGRVSRVTLALLMPFLLASCILVPGKFTSTLSIDADRSFRFTYAGEVIAVDLANEFGKGMAAGLSSNAGGDQATPDNSVGDGQNETHDSTDDAARKAAAKAETERKNRAIAEALMKEPGYRKVSYLGDGKFLIDYAISGTLTHNFIYPFNSDAEIIFPFIAVELRRGGVVRVKAPGFAKASGDAQTPGADQAASKLDGSFTLDTDAEIVSQNEEAGAITANGRKTITWKVSPLTAAAPMAVLKLQPLAA